MKMFVPPLATQIILNKPWTFTLYDEYRNNDIWHDVSADRRSTREVKVTLPVGTRLSVDRIYIRKGVKDYDSVTFRILKDSPLYPKRRFWAKLHEVNEGLEFDLLQAD